MSMFTSIFWSLFTADNLAIGTIDSSSYTIATYPQPQTLACSYPYLTLGYLCDPDQWLSHTDALKIDNFLKNSNFIDSSCYETAETENFASLLEENDYFSIQNRSKKQTSGNQSIDDSFSHNDDVISFLPVPSKRFGAVPNFQKSTFQIDGTKLNLGIALVERLKFRFQTPPNSTASLYHRLYAKANLDYATEKLAPPIMDKIADSILEKWTLQKTTPNILNKCQFDVILLIARELVIVTSTMPNKSIKDKYRFLIGVGLPKRLRNGVLKLNETQVMYRGLKNGQSITGSEENLILLDIVMEKIGRIDKIMQKLQEIGALIFGGRKPQNGDE